jgi:hypothetical protein
MTAGQGPGNDKAIERLRRRISDADRHARGRVQSRARSCNRLGVRYFVGSAGDLKHHDLGRADPGRERGLMPDQMSEPGVI